MRVDLRKFLFIGPSVDKERFFLEAQKTGLIEFINPHGQRKIPLSQEATDFATAIKILRGFVQEEQDEHRDFALAKQIAADILSRKKMLDTTQNTIRNLQQEIERIEPFGNFLPENLHAIEKDSERRFRFYFAKSSKHLATRSQELIYLNTVDDIDYFLAFTLDPLKIPDLFEMLIPEPLATLQNALQEQEKIVLQLERELKAFTRHNKLLHYALIEDLNILHLDFSKKSTTSQLEETVFSIEGWVPANKERELRQFVDTFGIFCEEIAVNPVETIPTCLENKGIPRVGEDIIGIFDTPSYHDKDPSMWVLGAFSLFFAMIVGDAGYGLIFLLTAFIITYKIKNLKGFAKRFVKLIVILAITCITWGVLMNSFFGVSLAPDNPLRKYSLLTWLIEKKADYHLQHKDDVYEFWIKKIPSLTTAANGKEFIALGDAAGTLENPNEKFNKNILMELAILIGSIHVILGLLRYIKKNPVGAGWILFIIGSYLYLPIYLNATSILHFAFGINKIKGAEIGLYLLIIGATYSILASLIRNGILGIFEVMTSIQILGDILSYLRIYALGLAGAIVASTINDLTNAVPLFIAVVLLVIAHAINIVLSIMGGTIHGLRLNFLEWYHYSFEGGGKKFIPLQLHKYE